MALGESDAARIARLEEQVRALKEALEERTTSLKHAIDGWAESQKGMADDMRMLRDALNISKGRASVGTLMLFFAGGSVTWLLDHVVTPLLGRH